MLKGTQNKRHGITLEAMVTALFRYYGWEALGERIKIRCFTHDPSIASSLKFLRRTPWAREQVEHLYLLTRVREDWEQRTSAADAER